MSSQRSTFLEYASPDFYEHGNITQPFKPWLRLLEEIRVWPPSVNLLIPELTLVCNCLLVDISSRSHRGAKCALIFTQLSSLVSKTVRRVLQFAMKVPVLQHTSHKEDADVETLMKTVVKMVEDPIARFRLQNCLSQLVLLCNLCFIDKRQRDGAKESTELLVVLEQLVKTVGQSVLQEVLPYRHGLVLCMQESPEDICAEANLCVGDVARLVKLSCHLIPENGPMKHKQWQWLDTLLQCKKLFIKKQYNMVMEKLEAELSQSLDPEHKSILLCQFAECYLQQGCSQLAIQTYKDALQANRRQHSVFLHLANVYKVMGHEELELESLSLLVKVLTDKSLRNEQRPLTIEIDALVMSVFQIEPSVTFSYAVHLLARCCTKLHRYKEAANHYLTLLKLLEDGESFTPEVTTEGPLLITDVKELVVETVEALSLAQQNTQCLSLCDEFYPILSTEDISPPPSFPDISVHNYENDFTVNNSSHSFFDQSQSYESADEAVASSIEHENFSIGKLRQGDKFETENSCFTSKCLSNIIKLSKQGETPTSSNQYKLQSMSSNREDAWWSKSLPVRLLLSKADALMAVHGFTQQTFDCLTKAFNLLMDPKTSIFVQDQNHLASPNHPPSKRRKLDSTEATDSQQSIAAVVGNPKLEERLEGSSEFPVSPTWKKSMMNVCSRMAMTSLKMHQTSSVLNSCCLILQLDPHNAAALYMKTVVLQDQGNQKGQASKLWLRERGIDCNSSVSVLQSVLEEKQKDLRNAESKQTTESKEWWLASETQRLSLDVTSLENIIESVQKQTKTSEFAKVKHS